MAFRSLFGGAGAKETLKRFDADKDLAKIRAKIVELKATKAALQQQADVNGPQSLAYLKNGELGKVLTAIDRCVDTYNTTTYTPTTDRAKMSSRLTLCKNVLGCLPDDKSPVKDELNARRGGAVTKYGIKAGLVNDEATTWRLVKELRSLLEKTIESYERILGQETRTFDRKQFVHGGALKAHSDDASTDTDSSDYEYEIDCLSDPTESYIKAMQADLRSRGYPSAVVERLQLTKQEQAQLPKDIFDPTTKKVMDIPVRVHGVALDYVRLITLDTDAGERRQDPSLESPFYMRDIQPAQDIADKTKHAIEQIQTKRAAASTSQRSRRRP